MTSARTPGQQITEAVAAWPGVETARGRRGEVAFKVGRRELGHLHGDHTAHFAFPQEVWLQLKEQSRIVEHPVFPGKAGPALRRIDLDADIRDVVELMRINYDRFVADPTAAPDTEGPGRPRELGYGRDGNRPSRLAATRLVVHRARRRGRRTGSRPGRPTRGRPGRRDQARSKRSRFITLTHAATKSRTNFSRASSLA
jgi:hypothetical protein